MTKYVSWRFIRGLPGGVLHTAQRKWFLLLSRREQFTRIFRGGGFGPSPSVSGTGSDLEQTERLREELPSLLERHYVKSMLDVPCGDLYWMRHVDLGAVRYLGADIVTELVEANSRAFAGGRHEFQICDLCCDELPGMDLILCRDCLVHMSFKHGLRALRNMRRSGSTYVLTTTYPGHRENAEIGPSFWRPINLERPPFSLPPPIDVILEGCTEGEGQFADKSLGLWRLADIHV